ncbi:MAG: anthranilate phosphoribosyltransferase [Phycisphaerales bacterium]|nr:MAG: anthranilate phosphoribosyltransferase [Phycisphaerales bacterium]
MRDTLAQLLDARPLDEAHAQRVFESIFRGEADDAQIGALLALIAQRGPTIDELVGAARAMRAHLTPVPYTPPETDALIDTCGTGGAPKTFNVSTAAALVVAAAHGARRVRVAKHGNRSRTGRGSAEVLGALGVNVDAPPEAQARCLDEAGLCFCFAIHHHPATRSAAPARQALGFPTIFNLLGPLTNPARAPRQLLGVYALRYTEPLAHALSRLGAERAVVVHSDDGMDEVSTLAPTRLAETHAGAVRTGVIDPSLFNFAPATLDDLRARDVPHAAQIIRDVLEGARGPARDIVLLNAAVALTVADAAPDLPSAFALASDAVDTGAATAALERLRTASHA